MRHDAVGLFWEDLPPEKGEGRRTQRPMPDIPHTGWKPPASFPNLAAARVLSIDTETYDPELLTHGPGWARGKGHIVGVSVAADDDGAWYFPVRHETEPEDNMSPEAVFAWLRDTLSNAKQPKIGANLPYDIGWLQEEGVHVHGDLVDVQSAEALLCERGEVNLDFLGAKYCGEGKEGSVLYQWLADWFGGEPNGKQRKHLYRAPPRLVGPYAEQDALLPLRVARAQWPHIAAQGLQRVLDMENGLIPLIVAMRRAGITVDVSRAEKLRERLLAEQQQAQEKLDKVAGCAVNVNAAASLATAFDAAGVAYPRTDKGSPSFTKTWLAHQPHPVAALVNEVRKLAKLRSTFIESYILDSHVNGKVYGQFHLLRGDDSGTRSGRFSSSTPNLQNIPSRDKDLAPLVRGIFIPDEGHKQIRRYDYSQIEYRFLVHFAVGEGADEARARFNADPHTDYHDFVIHMIKDMVGYVLSRKPAKTINFGLIYGMGLNKLLATLGLDKKEGKRLFDAYHAAIPYAKATMESTMQEAQDTGVITTIMGRRSRFDLWEPREWTDCAARKPLPYDAALRHYGAIQRAHTHKGLNRRLQGSAADLMKYAMWRCWEDGIFADTGVPRLTVHDELDFSDPGDKDAAFAHMRHVLETALPLRIPVRCEAEIGPDWGHCEPEQ